MPGERPDIALDTATDADSWPARRSPVFVPCPTVVPYSKYQLVAVPLGSTLPASTEPDSVTELAGPVTAVGGEAGGAVVLVVEVLVVVVVVDGVVVLVGAGTVSPAGAAAGADAAAGAVLTSSAPVSRDGARATPTWRVSPIHHGSVGRP